jgi:hypothetical protein
MNTVQKQSQWMALSMAFVAGGGCQHIKPLPQQPPPFLFLARLKKMGRSCTVMSRSGAQQSLPLAADDRRHDWPRKEMP